jgi:hypothetical protein
MTVLSAGFAVAFPAKAFRRGGLVQSVGGGRLGAAPAVHVETGFQLRDLKRHIRDRIRHFLVLTLQLENATISVQKSGFEHANLLAEKQNNKNDIGRPIPKKLFEHRILFGSGKFVREQVRGRCRCFSVLRLQFFHFRVVDINL